MNSNNLQRIEVYPKSATTRLSRISETITSKEGLKFDIINEAKSYLLSTHCDDIRKIKEVFHDCVTEDLYLEHNEELLESDFDYYVEVTFLPGVTDNPGHSAQDALKILSIESDVYSGKVYLIKTETGKENCQRIVEKYLANKLIQQIRITPRVELSDLRFKELSLPLIEMDTSHEIKEIPLNISDEDLEELSLKNCWALTLTELHTIREHYMNNRSNRQERGLPIWPTDVEIEVIAQTWSEHCKHKIFASTIEYTDENGNCETIDSLYKSYIKNTTKEIQSENKINWLKSVFTDNAGIVSYDDNIDLCIKVETHNSPSALDPYGGALTGILGVNRDILGCGLGARPIANTNVFCFANPKLPQLGQEDSLPQGLLNPQEILDGVHKGVEDGGNKSGIPTVNGAMFFDNDYAGKPLVFVGTVGVMPKRLPDGRPIEEKSPQVNDHIVMLGGAVGADGIHGATFSSLELNESSPLSAVQIGDPLTQKRVMDFLIEARDKGLYSSITDNGAGGLSSSIGEMAEGTNGATLHLDRCPLKYPGLDCFEVMISESQERMSLSVPEENLEELIELAKKYGVDATDLGRFHDGGTLDIYWHGKQFGSLDLDFLHNGLPKMNLIAKWEGERERVDWFGNQQRKETTDENFDLYFKTVLSSPNIASKEFYVRRYDHEVGASTHMKPFGGKSESGVNNAGGIWMHPYGGEENNGFLVGCGMAPRLSLFDPEFMAKVSVDEAIRNIVVHGGDPDHISLLDNFCWPDPIQSVKNQEGSSRLGDLVKASKGLRSACLAHKAPLVSGKDSMKNNFRGQNRRGEDITINVLPTLLVTSLGKYDIRHSIRPHFTKEDQLIYLIGNPSLGLKGSEFSVHYQEQKSVLPSIDLEKNAKLYRQFYLAGQRNLIQSAHDLSEGGLATSIFESCFGDMIGAEITLPNELDPIEFLFSESPGRLLVSVNKDDQKEFEEHFKDHSICKLGKTNNQEELSIHNYGNFNLKIYKEVWQKGLKS